jgi:heme/copper-type cytochrome/quinol oxidase subunit 2
VKSFPLAIVAVSISIICILSIGAVSALNPDEASVTTSWLSPKYYQGDTAAVIVTFQSNVADELDITRIGIQFDWMPSNAFYSYDLSANPVHIPASGSYTFELTNIRFLAGATAGDHSYFVSINYVQNNLNGIWNSPSLTIKIHDGNEKIYYELEPQISAKINNATYSSSEAQSLLQQAKTEYNNALSSAANEEWQEAVTSLRNASDYLDEAEVAEQQGGGQNTGSLLLYIAIAVIAVVIVLSVIAVAVRRRSKKTEFLEPVEPVESVE